MGACQAKEYNDYSEIDISKRKFNKNENQGNSINYDEVPNMKSPQTSSDIRSNRAKLLAKSTVIVTDGLGSVNTDERINETVKTFDDKRSEKLRLQSRENTYTLPFLKASGSNNKGIIPVNRNSQLSIIDFDNANNLSASQINLNNYFCPPLEVINENDKEFITSNNNTAKRFNQGNSNVITNSSNEIIIPAVKNFSIGHLNDNNVMNKSQNENSNLTNDLKEQNKYNNISNINNNDANISNVVNPSNNTILNTNPNASNITNNNQINTYDTNENINNTNESMSFSNNIDEKISYMQPKSQTPFSMITGINNIQLSTSNMTNLNTNNKYSMDNMNSNNIRIPIPTLHAKFESLLQTKTQVKDRNENSSITQKLAVPSFTDITNKFKSKSFLESKNSARSHNNLPQVIKEIELDHSIEDKNTNNNRSSYFRNKNNSASKSKKNTGNLNRSNNRNKNRFDEDNNNSDFKMNFEVKNNEKSFSQKVRSESKSKAEQLSKRLRAASYNKKNISTKTMSSNNDYTDENNNNMFSQLYNIGNNTNITNLIEDSFYKKGEVNNRSNMTGISNNRDLHNFLNNENAFTNAYNVVNNDNHQRNNEYLDQNMPVIDKKKWEKMKFFSFIDKEKFERFPNKSKQSIIDIIINILLILLFLYFPIFYLGVIFSSGIMKYHSTDITFNDYYSRFGIANKLSFL